ncbi:MAG: RNA polymerase-binding protein DksA [Gammaproteobacteria bacterium RIFCSPHIGHO2_02_FULL_42_13]|nr:MAG: RNA polymerase-binding protein DksA [Gammaproteobacteria bacterium RIFCSPHIGHO2_02_FULL_42_13]OGT69838.1 MAG: RNA polymerase-binding protein DksA [Gammaproteobacteria bacterium RIFCSPLOWO2_02_FULL_42_9]HLB57273.1 RNA polymerase-binding protein DksA [Gammaproteobacteria bacterium]
MKEKKYLQKKAEKYMSMRMKGFFKDRLLDLKNALIDKARQTPDNFRSNTGGCADESDMATKEEILASEILARTREAKLIEKINYSLAQLAAGDYGYCESCGDEIGLARLEIRPTATLCVDCKNLEEITEKQSGNYQKVFSGYEEEE